MEEEGNVGWSGIAESRVSLVVADAAARDMLLSFKQRIGLKKGGCSMNQERLVHRKVLTSHDDLLCAANQLSNGAGTSRSSVKLAIASPSVLS